jgi:tetraacyldisaccharide-1-P 4'-kinase
LEGERIAARLVPVGNIGGSAKGKQVPRLVNRLQSLGFTVQITSMAA